ncbi:MAG: hypothetical protein HYV40_03845 [Candidatus Levybacteria bacterium]|nr:hypothetical protein [Candidatus Levybacteria bacterium]
MPDTLIRQNNESPPIHPPFIKQHVIMILVGLVIASIALTTSLAYLYFTKESSPVKKTNNVNAVSISGTFDINGIIPTGGTIALLVRRDGEKDFQVGEGDIHATDGGTWFFGGATRNEPYDIKAVMNAGGQAVATSNTITVVAPADSEVLRFNIQSQQTSEVLTTISGTIGLNGYVPANASISIMAGLNGSPLATVSSGIPAVDNASWSFAKAVSGGLYSIQANIVVNGTTVVFSPLLSVSAPATNEALSINSSLIPPVPTPVPISGTININGYIPSGSTLSVAARQTGTTAFSPFVSNLQATDGTSWTYTSGLSGTSYDLQASLINNGTTVSQSQILTVPAPASVEVLTINTQNQPAAPLANSMTNSCVGKNPLTNLWQVQITYNTNNAVSNVDQYLLTIGNTQGGNQFVNTTSAPSNPSSPNQSQSYTTGFLFTEGQTYYTQWAYATCASCNTFSQNSPSLQFYCTTPLPTNTPVPTNTPIPTNTPSPTTPLPTTTPVPTG